MLVQKTDTPRPRPPAQVRRSTSLNKNFTTPPPAYASASALPLARKQPRLDSLLGSPMLATFQKVGWDVDGQPAGTAATHEADWVNDRARKRTGPRVRRVQDPVRGQRRPQVQTPSPPRASPRFLSVPYHIPRHIVSPLAPTSSGYAHSPATSPAPPTTYIRGHGRKISVSPADISLLSDQNAELLDKLERLEADSFSADRSGRRALKRLEKEIAGLRDELEKTQARSEEIEERAKAGFGWGAEKVVQEVWRKKKEREERFRAMKENLNTQTDVGEVRNFAPESPFGGMVYTPAPRRVATPSDDFFAEPREVHQPPPENQLISQLLTKIQELEETNERIIQQQTETSSQLQAVQRETEHINKVYEYLGDPNQFEVVEDMAEVSKDSHKISDEETIRFRSFKRTLEGQMATGIATRLAH
ncbi:hypothetical protein BD779DRAFT_1796465 [Infundibulicybe gibba]|nr:hypothetical protein BD779DRAFT_1796465 [Infundibulicybe gibba]